VEWGGKVVLLGIDLEYMTLLHAFEEMAEAPRTFSPGRETLYTVRRDGSVIVVPSRRHTWAPEVERDFPGLEPVLRDAGALRLGRIGDAAVRVVDARAASDLLIPRLRSDPSFFLLKTG
jgi:aminoglycoside 3-N-acetyltransferase